MPRLAANLTLLFNEVPFLERFVAAQASGFQGVEFLFPYAFDKQEIAAALQTHHLQNVLFNLSPGDWDQGERGLAALPGRESEFRDSVALALDYAQALGTRRLHVMSGIQPAGIAPEACTATLVANLRAACRQVAPHGIQLMIEPINTRDMPGYYLSRQAQAHDLLQQVGEPNLKVQMDFYHAQIMEGDLIHKLRRWQHNIGHVQIAGVPDRHEPDLGELNAAALFETLDQLGYDGWVGCEYRPRAGTLQGLGWARPYLEAEAH